MGRDTGTIMVEISPFAPRDTTALANLCDTVGRPCVALGGFFMSSAALPKVREFLARANRARKQARASGDLDAMLFWYTMAAQWLKRAEIYDLPDRPDNVVDFRREKIAWTRARSASQAALT